MTYFRFLPSLVFPLMVVLTGGFSSYLGAPSAVHAQTTAQIDSSSARVVTLTNQERTTRGLPALTINDRLVQAAQAHSQDQANNNFFSHTGSDGSSVSRRVTRTGYIWIAVAENIAAGQTTPEAVMRSWMNSTGHRANILNRNYTQIGVALSTNVNSTYKRYWTMVLAKPSATSSTPTPTPTPVATPTPTPTPVATPTPSSSPTPVDATIARVVELTNLERTSRGLSPLTNSSQLNFAALVHSEDMASKNFLSHTGSNGSLPSQRVTNTGYNWAALAENIAAGQNTPENVMQGWMNSQGHRANILNGEYTQIGVALVTNANSTYKHYWTMVLAKPLN